MARDWPTEQWPEDEAVNQWWQSGFTDGVDPEYEEQILPLARQHLAGARVCLDVGTGEGQLARLAAGLPGVEFVVGLDPTAAQLAAATARAGSRAGTGGHNSADNTGGNGGDNSEPRPAGDRAATRAGDRAATRAGDRAADGGSGEATGRADARRGGPAYVRGAAARLPFPDGGFDAALACLVFEHIDDVDAAIAEVGRVLAPGGRFLFFLNHPLLQAPGSGWVDDQILEEQYWRIGPYLVEDKTLEEVDRGIVLPFIHRPLSRYVNALADVGLLVTRMEEPAPPPGFLERAAEYAEAAAFPRLLFMRAEKLS